MGGGGRGTMGTITLNYSETWYIKILQISKIQKNDEKIIGASWAQGGIRQARALEGYVCVGFHSKYISVHNRNIIIIILCEKVVIVNKFVV